MPVPHSIWLLSGGVRPQLKAISPLALMRGAPPKTGDETTFWST
ncbi:MAG: hypothetical protein R3B46_04995 [Phycisphaerales bacterium]